MRNTSLEAIIEEKDLSVTIDRDMKFHMHVSKVVNKASRMLGLVRATFTCIDEMTLPRLFTTMVPLIWNMEMLCGVQGSQVTSWKLKKIQRKATKLIPNLRSLLYRDRLESPRLSSLR